MFREMPAILQKAAIALIIGSVALGFALIANGPLTYIFTIAIGCAGLSIALVLYLIFFISALR